MLLCALFEVALGFAYIGFTGKQTLEFVHYRTSPTKSFPKTGFVFFQLSCITVARLVYKIEVDYIFHHLVRQIAVEFLA